MLYYKVDWLHDHDDMPVVIYGELTDDCWETRKVEVFRDQSTGFASKAEATGPTMLAIEPWPAIEVIALDPQFRPESISQEVFEAVWASRAVRIHSE